MMTLEKSLEKSIETREIAATADTAEYLLGPVAQIPPGEGREFAIAGTLIAVFYARNGEIYATQATCPHRNGPLADGLLGGSTLVCPFHAWKFDLTTGSPLLGDCAITIYPVRLSNDGQIFVTIESSNGAAA